MVDASESNESTLLSGGQVQQASWDKMAKAWIRQGNGRKNGRLKHDTRLCDLSFIAGVIQMPWFEPEQLVEMILWKTKKRDSVTHQCIK